MYEIIITLNNGSVYKPVKDTLRKAQLLKSKMLKKKNVVSVEINETA